MKNVTYSIIFQSIRVLTLTSFVSMIGGVGIESVQKEILLLLPLLIMLPGMNDMIGDFGSTLSVKITTMLYEGKIAPGKWNREVHRLLRKLLVIALISSFYLSGVSYTLAILGGYPFEVGFLFRMVTIAVILTVSMVSTLFFISLTVGSHLFKKGKDPNNYLVPIATSLADVGTMTLFTLIVRFLF